MIIFYFLIIFLEYTSTLKWLFIKRYNNHIHSLYGYILSTSGEFPIIVDENNIVLNVIKKNKGWILKDFFSTNSFGDINNMQWIIHKWTYPINISKVK